MFALLRRDEAAVRRARRRQGRRDHGEQHLPGRLPQREPADPGQRHGRGAGRGVERLLFLGSSCIYPKLAPQPIHEDALLTGHLEETNDAYAIAKIAGILQIQAVRRQYGLPWISAMPTNLYGPGDNFSPQGSHVLPALIRRYDEAVESGADEVTNWGTGSPRREFLHVDDMADACLHLLEHYDGPQQVTSAPAGTHDQGDRRARRRGRRLRGQDPLGHQQARRHPAEAARRQQAGQRGLDREDRDARGAGVHGCVVPRARGGPAEVARALVSRRGSALKPTRPGAWPRQARPPRLAVSRVAWVRRARSARPASWSCRPSRRRTRPRRGELLVRLRVETRSSPSRQRTIIGRTSSVTGSSPSIEATTSSNSSTGGASLTPSASVTGVPPTAAAGSA